MEPGTALAVKHDKMMLARCLRVTMGWLQGFDFNLNRWWTTPKVRSRRINDMPGPEWPNIKNPLAITAEDHARRYRTARGIPLRRADLIEGQKEHDHGQERT